MQQSRLHAHPGQFSQISSASAADRVQPMHLSTPERLTAASNYSMRGSYPEPGRFRLKATPHEREPCAHAVRRPEMVATVLTNSTLLSGASLDGSHFYQQLRLASRLPCSLLEPGSPHPRGKAPTPKPNSWYIVDSPMRFIPTPILWRDHVSDIPFHVPALSRLRHLFHFNISSGGYVQHPGLTRQSLVESLHSLLGSHHIHRITPPDSNDREQLKKRVCDPWSHPRKTAIMHAC